MNIGLARSQLRQATSLLHRRYSGTCHGHRSQLSTTRMASSVSNASAAAAAAKPGVKRVLVTGGNKGIGLAIVKKLLDEHEGVEVLLGSRDAARGQEAVAWLQQQQPQQQQQQQQRVQLLQLDVSSDESVRAAAASLAQQYGGAHPRPLHAIINNAGLHTADLRICIDTNLLGVRRVVDAFLPLLDPAAGRIVNVSSGAAPSFVAKCSPDRQAMLINPDATWDDIDALVQQSLAIPPGPEAAAAYDALGLPGSSQLFAYSYSKALLNTYTVMLARDHPTLRINACTPGYIETDLTLPWAVASGKTPAEMGMKSPQQGATVPVMLAMGDVESSGWFYGSDGQRSPLDAPRPVG